ncbi:aromatic motif membrane protein [Mycoplasmopsis synoviae]|uniref:aromatic motif membrane protein n=2 Tax=Mycoplasmopsis synoviae TaxID=2109 RepID=UPI00387AA323
MKIKKILPAVFLTMAALPAISCASNSNANTNSNNVKSLFEKITKENVTINQRWNDFIESKAINSLLNLTFPKKENREKYIKEQNELNYDSKYKKDLKYWLSYGNNIQSALGSDSNFFFGDLPYPYENSRARVGQLFDNNWLWFLFNLDKFTFVNYPSVNLFEKTSTQYSIQSQENSLVLGTFYTPNSNKIIDFSTQIYESNDEILTANFWLLIEAGFLIRIEVRHYLQDELSDISLLGYLFTYPDLISSNNKLRDFNIKKYIEDNEDFDSKSVDQLKSLLFTERYGGSKLRYTVVDINNEK